MFKIKLLASAVLGLLSVGLLALAFAPHVGAGGRTVSVNPAQDPDLGPGTGEIDKELYLKLRSEWIMMRRGFDPERPGDAAARDRAIAQMAQQLTVLEGNRMQAEQATRVVNSIAWTPVGPAPVPAGQTTNRADPVSGRTISIAVHPKNPDIVFVGTAAGGLYRTLNGQAAQPTWTPMMDTVQMQSNGLNALGTLAIGAIAIAPSDPNVVYIGTGEQNLYFGSGLYRIDNATTANPTLVGPINPASTYDADQVTVGAFTLRAISQIVVHPTSPGTIFVATATGRGGLLTHNASSPPGTVPPAGIMGVYRSTNATAAPSSVTFAKLTVNTLAGYTTGNTDISDMVADPADATGNTILVWVRNGQGADAGPPCAAGSNCAGVYRSTNALSAAPTFTQTLVALNGGVRGELSINKVGNVVTVVAATGEAPASVPGAPNPNNCPSDQLGLLRRSTDGGATWPNTNATTAASAGLIRAADGFCGSQCFYDIGVALDPTNANVIQIGGNGNYGGCQTLTKRSTDGVIFAENLTGLHADVHVFTVAPSNNAIVWTGNDGGLWRSTDSGATWASMNGDPASSTSPVGKLSASQYISMATHPRDREYMTGGTQDNGTHLKRASTDTGEWKHIAGGDGGYTAIDQNATDAENVTVYHTYYSIAAGAKSEMTYERVTTKNDAKAKKWTTFNCVVGGASNTRIDCNDTAVSFYAPLVLGPGNPNTLYFGTDRLYRSADRGDTMQLVSQPSLAGSGVAMTAISIGQGNDNVRLVGMRNGTVWATTTGSNTLVNVTPTGAPAGVPVGKVLIDPNNTDPNAITAYIAYGGFGTAAAPIAHIWKTTNLAGGAGTWTAMSNGLPDVPVNAIAVDRLSATAPSAATTLYLGTDIGVYSSTDGGASWAVFNPNNVLPVVPIFDIAFQADQTAASRILRIATHGRGIWEIQTGSAPAASVQFAASTARVKENAGTAELTVNRTGNTAVPAAVNYSTGGGTAVPGQDYTPASGEITFAPGETSKTISVPILNDPNGEGNETFVASLSPSAGGTASGTVINGGQAALDEETITIVDDDAGGPAITQVASRKLHNGTPHDVNLVLDGDVLGVESRSGGPSGTHQLVFTFANPVTFSGADVEDGSGSVTNSSGSGTQTATVDLSGVADRQTITVTLYDVTEQSGAFDVTVSMGVLLGDANGDKIVNSGDVTYTRNRSGQSTDATNFRADYNQDGTINSGDATTVRSRSGNSLP